MKLPLPKLPEQFSKYTLYLWPVAAGLLTIIIVIFVIVPQISQIIQINQTIEANKVLVEKLNEKAQQLENIDSKTYEEHVKNTYIVLPVGKDYTSTIDQIQFLAIQAGFQISAFGLAGVSTSPTGFNSYAVKLTMSGSVEALNKFIDLLNKGPRVITLDNIDLAGGGSTYQFNLNLTAYFQPPAPQQTLPSIEQPVETITDAEIAQLTQINEVIANYQPPCEDCVSSEGSAPPSLGKTNPFE